MSQIIRTPFKLAIAVITLSLISILGILNSSQINAADTDITNGIVVDSTLDTSDANIGDGDCDDGDGNCTLRAAIEEANTNADLTPISFNIAPFDGSVKTFRPETVYPTITNPVTINGIGQNGASCEPRTLKIEINGEDMTSDNTEIMTITADDSSIRGIAFYGYATLTDTVRITDGQGSSVTCSNFGVNALGVNPYPSGDARSGGLAIVSSSNNVIGGNTLAERNVFSRNDSRSGLRIADDDEIASPDNNTIIGNYFGTDLSGNVATNMANGFSDMSLTAGSNNIIGGLSLAEGNVFATASAAGITISNSTSTPINDNQIIGNYFGVNKTLDVITGGGASSAVLVGYVPGANSIEGNVIGGTTPGSENHIYTSATAIQILSLGSGTEGGGTAVLRNFIVGNDFGVDLCTDTDFDIVCDENVGPDTNDLGDVDLGPNGYLNKPVISSISQQGNQITFTYNLDAIGSSVDQYRVDFYANDQDDSFGYGQSQRFLGTEVVDLSGGAATNLTATFTLGSTTDITSNVFSSLNTIIEPSSTYGFGSSSEFGTVVNDIPITYLPASQGTGVAVNSALAETGSSQLLAILFGLTIISLSFIRIKSTV